MPKSTVREDDPYAIPLDTLVPLTLESVAEVTVPFTYKNGPKAGTQGSFVKWEWNFRVSDGEFNGIEVRASTEPKVTNAAHQAGNLGLALPYVEALLGRGLDIGEEVDTDTYIGLTCQGTVRHLDPRPKRDGDGFWFNVEIDEVFPLHPTNGTTASAQPQTMQDTVFAGQRGGMTEPPF